MMKVFLQEAVLENEPIPGAVIAIQSFGDFLGFNPHCHILVTDGWVFTGTDCFCGSFKGSLHSGQFYKLALYYLFHF